MKASRSHAPLRCVAHRDGDLTFARVLDRVGDRIGDDLAHAVLVTEHEAHLWSVVTEKSILQRLPPPFVHLDRLARPCREIERLLQEELVAISCL